MKIQYNPSSQIVRMSNKQHGGALLVVLSIMVLISTILASAGFITTQIYRNADRSNDIMSATFAAEAGLQTIFADMDTTLTMTNSSLLPLSEISKIINTSKAPYAVVSSNKFRFLNYTVLPLSSNGIPSTTSDNTVVNGKQNRFVSVVWVQSLENPSVIVKLQQELAYKFEPLFQYAIFFEQELKIIAGADALYGGRVHSNGELTIGNSWNSTTTFLGPVTSVSSPLSNYFGANMYAKSDRGYNSNTNGNIWNGTMLRYNRASLEAYEQNPVSTFIFSNSVPAKVSRRQIPAATNLAAGSYTTNYTGNGNLITNIVANNPNASANGAVELIQRPDFNYIDPYAPPSSSNTDPYASANTRMYYKSSLRIIVEGTGTGRVPKFYTGDVDAMKPHGDEIPLLLTNYMKDSNGIVTNTQVSTNQTYLLLSNAFNANGKISDYRWSATYGVNGEITKNKKENGVTNVTTVDFDVSKILDSNGNITNALYDTGATNVTIPYTPLTNFNGVIYVSNIDGSSTNKTGVKLINGEKLPNALIVNGVTNKSNLGLTVVTDNPLYIIGDYNTGGKGTSVPNNSNGTNDLSMAGNITNSTVSGYTRKPASIMSDAFSALSAAYATNQTDSNFENRLPVHTTMNLAVLTGTNREIISNSVSEGVGNMPRMMENWSYENKGKYRQKLAINGSMVNIFYSEQAKNLNYCNPLNLPSPFNPNDFDQYYQPPARCFSYDPLFDDPQNLPPGTPVVRVFGTSQWAKVH